MPYFQLFYKLIYIFLIDSFEISVNLIQFILTIKNIESPRKTYIILMKRGL